MAGRGPAPKKKPLGHKSKADLAKVEIEVEPPTATPELPDSYQFELTTRDYIDGKQITTKESVTLDYVDQTRAWWADWKAAPQADLFTVTTWRRLLMLAPLVDQFHRTGSKDLMAEIRLNEAKLGATPEDMQRLHWSPKAAQRSAAASRDGKVTPINRPRVAG